MLDLGSIHLYYQFTSSFIEYVLSCLGKSILYFQTSTTLHTSDIRYVVFFPPHQPILQYQLDVLQFNSTLTLTSTDPIGCPALQLPIVNSRSPGYPQLLSNLVKIRGSHEPLFGYDHWLEELTELREKLPFIG